MAVLDIVRIGEPALRAGPFTSAVEHTAGAHAALMEGALRGGLRVAAEVRAAAA